MKWKIGDKCAAVATVESVVNSTVNRGLRRELFRAETPIEGICLGWTIRNEGPVHRSWGSGEDYEQGVMVIEKTHKVYVVQPPGTAERYRKPYLVLEADMREVTA